MASRVEQLEKTIADGEMASRQQKYNTDRQQEFVALANEFPDALRYKKTDKSDPTYRLAEHIVQIAEDRTKATGKIVPYADVYKEYVEMSGKEPPHAAPATSPSGGPARPQAPRNKKPRAAIGYCPP